MTVRKLKICELPGLTELFEYASVEDMIAENTQGIQDNSADIFALFEGEKLIGELHVKYFCDDVRFAQKGKRAYLFAFRIHSRYQSRGCGQFLLESVLAALEKTGCSEFTIGVEDDNARARHIYEKYGFTRHIARLEESYQGDSYEYDLMLKTLQ